MKNNSKTKAAVNQMTKKTEKEIQSVLFNRGLNNIVISEEEENDLNAKILKITMKIKGEYPELSKYLEEMPVTIPDEKSPKITSKNLREYYDSLNAILKKYILEHSSIIK